MAQATAKTMMAGLPRPRDAGAGDASVLSRLAALKTMSVKNLKVEWRSLFGSDAPNNSRSFSSSGSIAFKNWPTADSSS